MTSSFMFFKMFRNFFQRPPFFHGSFWRYTLVLILVFSNLFLICCGSGGNGSSDTPADNGNDDTTPLLTWNVEYGVKNPVTDLGACIESVFACLESGTALKDCFGTQVSVCTDAEPTDGCCMQACGDQLAQKLDSGTNEQDAFLEVFVYDGTCMPNIAEVKNQ
jgi:hypothetical protein